MKQSTISFLVTPSEFELLADVVHLEPYLDDVIARVKAEEGGLRLKFTYDDLDEAIHALEHQVGYDPDVERRKQFAAFCRKLEGYKRLRPHVQVHGKVVLKKKGAAAKTVTAFVFDVRLLQGPGEVPQVERRIAVSGGRSLEHLAKTAIESFGFRLDHCFGFYGDVQGHPTSTQQEIYELFVDLGEEPAGPHAQGVKKPKIAAVFNAIGKTMLLVFDYGDDWRFAVELIETRPALAAEKLPVVLKKTGQAPPQYPPFEE